MSDTGNRPKAFVVAIRRLGADPAEGDARFVRVFAGTEDHARRQLVTRQLLDPRTEEVVGIEEEPEPGV
jgi:hypothetical protein